MKKIIAMIVALVLLLAVCSGCGSKTVKGLDAFEDALAEMEDADNAEFFAQVQLIFDLALLQEESSINTDDWTVSILGSGYQSSAFTIAGYETTITLSVNSGYITGAAFTFKGIDADIFEDIAAAAEDALGESDRSGSTIIMLLWSDASLVYQSGASSCEFLVY